MAGDPECEAGVSRAVVELDAVLPQTQCTRCGYPDCLAYARAMATGSAPINRCPPGGDATVALLSALTGQPVVALDPARGAPAPRRLAQVDERWCIGCTRCIEACPVDAIVGARRRMHVVIRALCTGCELCLAPCPVECIEMVADEHGPRTPRQWLAERAAESGARYRRRAARLRQRAAAPAPGAAARGPATLTAAQRRGAIAEAVARTRAARSRQGR